MRAPATATPGGGEHPMTPNALSKPTSALSIALPLAIAAPLTALAHGGHGEPSHAGTLAHYLGEPAHAVALAAAMLAVAGLLEWRRARRLARTRERSR